MLIKSEAFEKFHKIIKLDKPLVVFDIETTGLAVSYDRIIEIAYLKIMPDGKAIKDDIFLDPEIKISEEASAVHGVRNEDLVGKPTFKDKAAELFEIFDGCFYSGFNIINFDLLMLRREFIRVGLNFEYSNRNIIDVKTIYHYMEPRTLSAAYKFYCGKEHENAHNALADVEVTFEVLMGQIERYKEVSDLDFLQKLHNVRDTVYVDTDRKFYWRDGEAIFAFSKFRDVPLSKVVQTDRGFLEWILSADFSDETKIIISNALKGEFPKR